jgi:hypothetical protein
MEWSSRAARAAQGATDPQPNLLALSDLTLAHMVRHLTRHGESGTILDEDGLLLFAGAHPQPNPYRNGAIRLDRSMAADEVLARSVEFFNAHGRGFALWASEHADEDLAALATARGFVELESLPELVRRGLPEPLPPPFGVDIREASDEVIRRDYVKVVAEAWGMGGMPHEIASRIFFSTASVDVPHVAAFVAYIDDAPVSGAMTLVTDGVALGCQAATVRRLPSPVVRSQAPVSRRRGLADSCLCAALERSHAEFGIEISLCQTSSLGAPVWLRLGYEPFTSYKRYLVPPNTGLRR